MSFSQNQMQTAGLEQQIASNIANFSPAQLAEFHRDLGHSLYNHGINMHLPFSQSISILRSALDHFRSIPHEYATIDDCEKCIITQSTLTLIALFGAAQRLTHTQDLATNQEGLSYLKIANSENIKFADFVKNLQQHGPELLIASARFKKVIADHPRDYLELLKKIFLNSDHLDTHSKMFIIVRLLQAYREISIDGRTNSDLYEMSIMQTCLLEESSVFIPNLLQTRSYANLKIAHEYQLFLVNEYLLISLAAPLDKQRKINHLFATKNYVVLKLDMANLSPNPYDDKHLQLVDEAIRINDQIVADLNNAVQTDVEKKSHYDLCHQFAIFLKQYAEGLPATHVDKNAIQFHVSAALKNIPANNPDTIISSHNNDVNQLAAILQKTGIFATPIESSMEPTNTSQKQTMENTEIPATKIHR